MWLNTKKLSLPLALALALVASAFPLTCYVLSLSLFGLPHIYCELSYIYDRLYPRVPRQFMGSVLLILVVLCACNLMAIFIPVNHYLEIALSLAFLLFVVAYIFAPSLLALACLLLFGIAIILNPVMVFFLMAFLHNLTPWGFLKERGASQNAILVFIVLPIAVFFLAMVCAQDHFYYAQATASVYLTHYIPRQYQALPWTQSLFAAAVYLQLIHYDSTIRLLPGFMTQRIKLPWVLMAVFAFTACAFMYDFQMSRSLYSVFATFHAWLEVPVLLAMFAMSTTPNSMPPLAVTATHSTLDKV